jgi:hypothetical protein
MAIRIDDIGRDDAGMAFRYLREQNEELGFVLMEEVGMLAGMQHDFPDSVDRFVRALEKEGIEVRGEFF